MPMLMVTFGPNINYKNHVDTLSHAVINMLLK